MVLYLIKLVKGLSTRENTAVECSVTDFIDNYIYVFEYNQSLMVCDRSVFDIMNYWWWPNAFLWFWSATGLSPLPQFLPQRIHKVEICSYLPSRSLRARSLRCLAQPLAQQANPLTSATRIIFVFYRDNIIYVNKYRFMFVRIILRTLFPDLFRSNTTLDRKIGDLWCTWSSFNPIFQKFEYRSQELNTCNAIISVLNPKVL